MDKSSLSVVHRWCCRRKWFLFIFFTGPISTNIGIKGSLNNEIQQANLNDVCLHSLQHG